MELKDLITGFVGAFFAFAFFKVSKEIEDGQARELERKQGTSRLFYSLKDVFSILHHNLLVLKEAEKGIRISSLTHLKVFDGCFIIERFTTSDLLWIRRHELIEAYNEFQISYKIYQSQLENIENCLLEISKELKEQICNQLQNEDMKRQVNFKIYKNYNQVIEGLIKRTENLIDKNKDLLAMLLFENERKTLFTNIFIRKVARYNKKESERIKKESEKLEKGIKTIDNKKGDN